VLFGEVTSVKEAENFVRLREYKHNLKEGHFDEAKLALHAFEEKFKSNWKQARVL
jgi:hypothetical protein